MRILPILLASFLTIGPLLGQSVQDVDGVTLAYEDAPLIEILDYLGDTYEISFAYDVAVLSKIRVSIKVDQSTLQNVLQELLSPHNLDFQLQPEGVLIFPGKNEPNKVDRLDWNGAIYDASTGETLPFASIMIRNTDVGTSTNADGYFLLQNIPDTSEIIISYLGYQPKTLPVSEAIQTRTILLDSREEQLPELLVTHQVEAFEPHRDAGHTTFNPRSLTGLPTLG
ncbi:MAG: carboxypeptidase-like regulatory domain-containing protein, partial [Flavobacteriaceae bacterium]